jgi:hypothetical protein
MSPEEADDEAAPPRGRIDAARHPRPDTQAMPKAVDLGLSRADRATALIEFVWRRFGIGHWVERSRLFAGPEFRNDP